MAARYYDLNFVTQVTSLPFQPLAPPDYFYPGRPGFIDCAHGTLNQKRSQSEVLMGRRRLKPAGPVVYHHVMTRCAQGCYWLEDSGVKDIFVDLIEYYSQVYYVKVVGYAVMDNHYHLCLEMNHPELDVEDIRRRYEIAQDRVVYKRPFQKWRAEHLHRRYSDLSWFMWEINRRMSLEHNKAKGTKGHLWSGRFKNVVVESGQSLLNVLAYIELNPVRANMVEDPAEFPYSSVGEIKRRLDKGVTSRTPVQGLESVPEKQRAACYVAWICYIAVAFKDPDLKRQGLPLKFTTLGWQVDMTAVYEALDGKSPGNWSNLVYGSASFEEQTLIDAGWLAKMRPKKEQPETGHSHAVA